MPKRLALFALVAAAAACAPDRGLPSEPDAGSPAGPLAGPPPVSTNTPPALVISSPAAGFTGTVGVPVDVSADFTDVDPNDTHTCGLDWQLAATSGSVVESGGTGTCTGSFVYSAAGTYTIQVAIIDNQGGTAIGSIDIAVAAPAPPPPPSTDHGSILGVGRVALAKDGKGRPSPAAWFEIKVSHSRDGKKVKATVAIQKGDLRFAGEAIESFAVHDSRADLRGTGKLWRRGTYSFLICAIDGGERRHKDRIRIKIWNATGVLFDTDPGEPDTIAPSRLVDGRIVVQP